MDRLNPNAHDREKREAPTRDWRHVHHSPWFWVGVAMFLAAIMTYVLSEDLSLRPRRAGAVQNGVGQPMELPSARP